jgi:membrane protein
LPSVSTPPALFPALHRRLEHWLFDLPEAFGGRPLRWLFAPLRYLYALLRDVTRGELGLHAMSLVYSTLFAIVPLIAVAFSVLQAFGIHRELEPLLRDFLRPLGAQGATLATRLMGFVENVQGTILGTVGFLFLLYTVLSMIQKVEQALNFVWHVERPRSFARRATEYLVVALVGPVVAVLAMVMLARFEASEVVARVAGEDPGRTHLAPYLMVIGLFLFLYAYMPNVRVRIGPAFVGALFAGAVWSATGALFARIVLYSAKTAAVYAGFAVVLLFLVWLHLSWLIMLLGAQLSFYVQHPAHLRAGHEEVPVTGALRERIALSVMQLIGERFLAGGPRWTIAELAERLDVPGTALDGIVSALQAHGLVLDVEDDTVAPARDLAAIRLQDVLDAVRHEVPDPRRPAPRALPVVDRVANEAEDALRSRLAGRSLRDLLEPPA